MAPLEELVRRLGGSFATELGIQLAASRESEIFKWFLASFLYGARISGLIASKTYREFEKRGVLTPQKIQDTGWDGLVEILDAGGYVRYDFSTATKLLAVSADLIAHYGGRLSNVHVASADDRDLQKRLQSTGKGIGPVTANIFLRELRSIWSKAEPLPSELVASAAKHLGLVGSKVRRSKQMLELLKEKWERAKVRRFSFVDFEAALVRLGRDYCRKKMHAECPMAQWCPTGGFAGRSK